MAGGKGKTGKFGWFVIGVVVGMLIMVYVFYKDKGPVSSPVGLSASVTYVTSSTLQTESPSVRVIP